MSSTRSTASAGRSTSTRRRSRPASPRSTTPRMSRRARAHNDEWLAWLTEEIGKLGLDGDAERRQFRADPLSRHARAAPPTDADAFLTEARADPAPGRRLQAAERAAHDGRHRGGQPAGGQGARRVHEGEATGVTEAEPIFNRLALIGVGLIGSSIARAARAQGAVALDRRHRALAGDAQARGRARHRRSGGRDQRRSGRRRRPRHRLHPGRRLRRGRARRSARISTPGAIVSDVGSVKGSVRARHGAAPARRACISCPAHPVAGTEHSGPDAGFAELFVNRWCILTPPPKAPTRPRSSGSPRSGARSAPMSRP